MQIHFFLETPSPFFIAQHSRDEDDVLDSAGTLESRIGEFF
jgi:hypothetical protein